MYWPIPTNGQGQKGSPSSHPKSVAKAHQQDEHGNVKQQFIGKVAELKQTNDLAEAANIAHEIQVRKHPFRKILIGVMSLELR
jgi:hypothetical protein